MELHKLIIVDDEIETRNALAHYFPWSELGFKVQGLFENGKETLEYIRNEVPHVVLSDIRMPMMSGLELTGELYRLFPSVKVILLSGYADFEFARQALVFGVKDYVLKPAKFQEMIKVFSRIQNELKNERSERPDDVSHHLTKHFNYDDEVIAKIKAYIESNYRYASLKEASDLVRMNPSYLSQFFKSKTGEYFSQYLLNVRMQAALQQLKDIHNKIYDVSENVGYANPKNFTRSFKNFFGKTPMEFRRGTENEE